MRISKTIAAVAVAMVVAQPVAAVAARPADTAQKLSLKNAVPADARVSAKAGKNKALSAGLILLVVAAAVGVIAIASSGSDSN
ncbi:hypothetical protein [uncultured Sphingomonas sp.]|uniref:hypothetical protein n=1 Tax=uncultured Sphingomonas sp. TaxID=158754 RepID=UPI0025D0DC0F|nr:hypothetical protein [uncultured Sphingomonas sp.]